MRVSTIAPNQAEAAWPTDIEADTDAESDAPGPHDPKPVVHVMPLILGAPSMRDGGDWHVSLDHLDSDGRVLVAEEPGTGDAHVLVKLFGSAGRAGLQMEADVRTIWVAATCDGAESDAERAWRLVRAITSIAGLPNQHTVSVAAIA
jgi:hypothetical protein